MQSLLLFSLYLHIAAGTLSLITGPLALLAVKGGQRHILIGKVFVYAMTLVFISAVFNGIIKEMTFLTMIAVFSYYNILAGIRALYLRRGVKQSWVDVLLHGVTIVVMLSFLLFGARHFTGNNLIGFLSFFFGVAGLSNAYGFIKVLRITDPRKQRVRLLISHISGLTGGFIASITAFSVQTMGFLPDLLQWLWPTFVFVPVIVYWSRKTRLRETT